MQSGCARRSLGGAAIAAANLAAHSYGSLVLLFGRVLDLGRIAHADALTGAQPEVCVWVHEGFEYRHGALISRLCTRCKAGGATLATSKFVGAATRGDAIVIEGFSQLQQALGRIENGVQPELRRRLKAIGDKVALVAAGNAPRITGELQHSLKTSVTNSSASIYSTAVYGGAQNFGAWTKNGRGPHISRARASHYMDRAVTELSAWVEQETNGVLDWLLTTFEEDASV